MFQISFGRLILLVLAVALVFPAVAEASRSTGKVDLAPAKRRVVILGLKQRGKPGRFAARVSNPASANYRHFLTLAQYRKRFSARRADIRRVRRTLGSRKGVRKLSISPNRSTALVIVSPTAGKRLFCIKGPQPPTGRLCRPKRLRRSVRLVSAGEVYRPTRNLRVSSARAGAGNSGTPIGCRGAIRSGAFTPNQLSAAYGVDGLHSKGSTGKGIRVATLSSQPVDTGIFNAWAKCFNLPVPKVRQVKMPDGVAGTSPEETVLDIEALATLAPGLDRITPIFVPLDQGFGNSFVEFMIGALDPSRQSGRLPNVLSISDGVCENRFTGAQLHLGQRLLAQAAAMGITTLAASGDLGFQGCFTNARGTLFPGSSRYVTSVGGTSLSLTEDNRIASQIVWSTYADDPSQGVGSGGGPSHAWKRPGYQRAPGIGPKLQDGTPTRLSPDLASMASFAPGLAVYDPSGPGSPWGVGGGTSAAAPLTAAVVALALQQEEKAGRPPLGSLPPLLYRLARGPAYSSIFYDITGGTSSRKPKSAAGKRSSGGAAQPGYDLATGLGSLKATAFADAVAALPPRSTRSASSCRGPRHFRTRQLEPKSCAGALRW